MFNVAGKDTSVLGIDVSKFPIIPIAQPHSKKRLNYRLNYALIVNKDGLQIVQNVDVTVNICIHECHVSSIISNKSISSPGIYRLPTGIRNFTVIIFNHRRRKAGRHRKREKKSWVRYDMQGYS
jgi:hypothetical protein